jgi:acyl-CoA-binding protein
VFIDADENEHEALESSRFKPIWDVVNALRSHDDDLAQELDQLRISLGQRNPIRGKSDGLKKVVFDLPVMCGQSFVDGLRTVLVERTTSSWMFGFGLLHQYSQRNGDARPPQNYKNKDGFALGVWVAAQRQKRESLSQDRIALLESLKEWSWDPYTDQWNDGYQALMVYVAQNGDARPPQNYKTKDGFALRVWANTQRQNRAILSQDRIALLESLKGWSWDLRTDQWNDGYQALMVYVAQNGDAKPSATFTTKDGFALGSWVSNQRQKRESLSQDRIALLEAVKGWSWDPFADQWSDGYQALSAYVVQTGDARPPKSFRTTDGFALGDWVAAQRQKRDILSQDRIALLEALKGWSWDPYVDQWNDGYQALKTYVAKNGDARPPSTFKTKDGFALGSWVSTQRQKSESLSQDRIALLEALKGWSWDPYVDQWNDHYQALTMYVAQNGDAQPPATFKTKDGFALGKWVSSQRKNRDSLSQDRIALLESLKGWSWDPFADQWSDCYQALKAYVAETGNARPPNSFRTLDGFALGLWMTRQRQNRDSLSQVRIALLESLKGWSWSSKLKQTPKDTPSS